MQSQMIGMQSSLDRILNAVQGQNHANAQMMHQSGMYPPSRDGAYNGQPVSTGRNDLGDPYGSPPSRPRFPPLPGFAAPVRALSWGRYYPTDPPVCF